MKVKACLRSGFCCKKGPCGFGESISNTEPQCKHLVVEDDGTTGCGIYSEIIKDPTSKFSPAFGSGCCMPLFNEAREAIKKSKYLGVEQYITIEEVKW